MCCGPTVRLQLVIPEVEVQDVTFDWKVTQDPYDTDDVETQESRLGGIAIRDDRTEGQSIAIETHQNKYYDSLVLISFEYYSRSYLHRRRL